MPCFHPREIMVHKPRVVYKWCERPDGSLYRERDENGKLVVLGVDKQYAIQVPCGKCRWCLAQQQSQWSFRIEQEVLNGGHAQSLFVTFTYDPEHLPSDFSVSKTEVQKYLHDLRQNLYRRYFDGTYSESVPIVKYYFCAEYGSKFGRPHYHAILCFSKSIDWKIIQSSWAKGIVDIRPFLSARAGYVAKYSVKDMSLDYAGRERPFHLQSKGLGACFLKGRSFASLKFNTYYANQSGHKVKLPRYYLDKLGTIRSYTDVGNSRKSHSYHTASYLYTNEVARFRFIRNNELELAKSGLSLADFLMQKNLDSQNLENQLEQLYLKTSSYYVLSRFESRTLQESVQRAF